MQAIKNNDRDALLNLEAQQRSAYGMPPYGRLIAIVLSSLDNQKVEQTAHDLVKCAPQHPDVTVLGPIPAPLAKLRSRYRWRLLVKGPSNLRLQNFVRSMQTAVTIPASVRMTIDVDPYNFL
jgi:primosomal protein N' (replication factor Y)